MKKNNLLIKVEEEEEELNEGLLDDDDEDEEEEERSWKRRNADEDWKFFNRLSRFFYCTVSSFVCICTIVVSRKNVMNILK